MSLQEALKMLRMELGLSQEDLAKRINKAYITVNRWENGKGFPSRSSAKKILDTAKDEHASKECISYLNKVLLPDIKREISATEYGYPDISRDFMFQLADGSKNAIYVIDAENYQLLYTNLETENRAVQYLSELGIYTDKRRLAEQNDKRCFHYFGNRDEPCPFCPLKKMNSSEDKDVIVKINEKGKKVHVHIKVSKLANRVVYVIYLTDFWQEN